MENELKPLILALLVLTKQMSRHTWDVSMQEMGLMRTKG